MTNEVKITGIFLFLIMIIYYVYVKNKIFYVNSKSYFKLTNLNNKKIIIGTIETRKLKILDIHNKNVSDYAKKYNYKYIFTDNYKNNLELPVYWKKIQFIFEILQNEDCDYVLWLDSDAFITDDTIPLESLIELSPNSSIFIGKDLTFNIFPPYCAGVFMIKNDEFGKNFLSDCINTYINSDCKDGNKYSLKGAWAGDCYEQGVMNKLINTKYKKYVFEIPQSFVLNTGTISNNTVISHIFGNKNDAYRKIVSFLKNKK